ncbi:hypothetical protein [Actinophytocola sp. KF-1]
MIGEPFRHQEPPDDELAEEPRAEHATEPVRHARYQREYPGWGVFASVDR